MTIVIAVFLLRSDVTDLVCNNLFEFSFEHFVTGADALESWREREWTKENGRNVDERNPVSENRK